MVCRSSPLEGARPRVGLSPYPRSSILHMEEWDPVERSPILPPRPALATRRGPTNRSAPSVSRQRWPPRTMLSYNIIAIKSYSVGAGIWSKQKWSVGQFKCEAASKTWTCESVTINNEIHQSVDQWFSVLCRSSTQIQVCKQILSVTLEFRDESSQKFAREGRTYGAYIHTEYTCR